MRTDVDAIVIGSGPNGLVAANLLTDAGWSVLVLEAQDHPGGAVHSDSVVAPDFVHDTFSSFYPFGAASPVLQALELEKHGLVWSHAPAVLGNPLPDGSWALLHREVEHTVAGLEAHTAGDGKAWHDLYQTWRKIGPSLVEAMMTPFPPIRGGAKVLWNLPRVGGMNYLRTLVEPASLMVSKQFTGEAARLLLAGNAGHADIPLTAPGSGLLGLLLAMLGQTVGFPVPAGGSGKLTEALVARFTALGGRIECDRQVIGIDPRRRSRSVRTADGGRIVARVIIADVAATSLYGDLIPWSQLPDRIRAGMARFDQDPATIKVDWALNGPVPWRDPPPTEPGTVHIADSLDQLTHAQDSIKNHRIPAVPFLLAGQMTTADPTRSPAGTESMWAYTHLPQEVHQDEGPDGLTGLWDHDEINRMADRMQERICRYAPDFESRIISRRILGPHQLQARDANLINGALNGGSSGLHQEAVFRPVPGLGRAGTPFRGIFLGSASAHPGGGVHGACGANAARAALAAARTGRL